MEVSRANAVYQVVFHQRIAMSVGCSKDNLLTLDEANVSPSREVFQHQFPPWQGRKWRKLSINVLMAHPCVGSTGVDKLQKFKGNQGNRKLPVAHLVSRSTSFGTLRSLRRHLRHVAILTAVTIFVERVIIKVCYQRRLSHSKSRLWIWHTLPIQILACYHW